MGSAEAKARVSVERDADIVTARQKGREMAEQLGLSSTNLTLVATAISELARNILLYAHRGEILLESLEGSNGRAIVVVARDSGPGIPDIERAMQSGYSTSGSLGLGLSGVKRLMDEFEIISEVGKGTTVTVKKWNR